MKRTGRAAAAVLLAWAACAAQAMAGSDAAQFTLAPFGTVQLLNAVRDAGSVVVFSSADAGWNSRAQQLAETLAARGTLVVGIDTRHYIAALDADGKGCREIAVDFEALAHAAEKHAGMPDYRLPVLVGDAAGAALSYAVLGAAPRGTFAAAIGIGFTPELRLRRNPCRSSGLAYTRAAGADRIALGPLQQRDTRWIPLPPAASTALAGEAAAAAVASVAVDATHTSVGTAPAAADLQDLPLIEVPTTATTQAAPGRSLVILLTGDGGWAGIDQQLAAALAQHGVPVVGWNSLRYYWNPRAPARASADLTRLIEHYLARWSRRDVVLVGYSFGADVLPFLVRRLDTATRARVRALVLLAPSQTASFEVHVSEWLPGGNQGDLPTIPEARQLGSMPVLCLYGREDHESICPRVATAGWRATPLEGKHHFGGDYEQLASSVLQFLGP